MNDPRIGRREWLQRAARAGASVAAVGGLGWALHGRNLPSPDPMAPPGHVFPDWSIPDAPPRLAIVTGRDRVQTLHRALAALGGIERFIRPGDRVVVKPNIGFATPAELGATSHPDIVRALVRRCVAAGAASVVVTDYPVNDPDSTFELTGIAQATREAGGRVVLPREDRFRNATLGGAQLIRDWPILAQPFDGVTKVIGLCPVKDHVRSGATLTLKNWYGLLGGRRNLFHQQIHDIIAELAMLVRPTLSILDGTRSMMTNGPTGGSQGDLKDTLTLIAGTDPVAVDAFGATLLDRRPEDVPWLAKAAAAGAGTTDWASLNPIRVAVD